MDFNERVRRIKAMTGVDQQWSTPYHCRLDGRLDLYPKNGRWHDLLGGERGGEDDLAKFAADRLARAAGKPSMDDFVGRRRFRSVCGPWTLYDLSRRASHDGISYGHPSDAMQARMRAVVAEQDKTAKQWLRDRLFVADDRDPDALARKQAKFDAVFSRTDVRTFTEWLTSWS